MKRRAVWPEELCGNARGLPISAPPANNPVGNKTVGKALPRIAENAGWQSMSLGELKERSLFCHIERSEAESRYLAANGARVPSLARFLRAGFAPFPTFLDPARPNR